MKFEPRAYQPPAIQHLEEVPFCALWADMGLGKTVSALTATANRIGTLTTQRTLVVAPLRVATMVWAQECRKWDHLQWMPVQLIRAHRRKGSTQVLDYDAMLAQARLDVPIHVIPFDQLKWLVQALGGKWYWDHVIVDESSKLKNTQSWRFKALWHVRKRIKHMDQLSGTPATSGLRNLYGQIFMLDQGKALGRTQSQFLDRWFYQADRDGRDFQPIDGALEDITQRLQHLCFSLEAKDYLDLPPLIVNQVRVTLPPKVRDQYDKMEREMYLELDAGAIDSVNAAVASGKCHQFANGAVWVTQDEDKPDEKRRWQHFHDEKLEALADIVDAHGDEPMLVAYNFKHDLTRLRKAFPQGVVFDSDPETEARWNRGEIPILFLHPKGAGHGLNLQEGGRRIVFFSLTWSLEDYLQIIERIGPTRQLQIGNPRPVYVDIIMADDTVDELILQRLETHATAQQILRKAMKRKLAA